MIRSWAAFSRDITCSLILIVLMVVCVIRRICGFGHVRQRLLNLQLHASDKGSIRYKYFVVL